MEPTVVTYNAIISGFARNVFSSAAYEWFDRMKARNIPPNHVTYEMMIEALVNKGKPRLAYELYLRAQTQCLALSSKAYDTVVQSSLESGANIDIRLLGERPPERKGMCKVETLPAKFLKRQKFHNSQEMQKHL